MSIFRKAEELSSVPKSINDALFDDHQIVIADEFDSLIKEASDNRSVYENRLKSFKQAQQNHDFEKPLPAKYAESTGGIRRSGYGELFPGEKSIYGSEHVRDINLDNDRYAQNGLSIWEPEFDELESAFKQSQQKTDDVFNSRIAAEKKAVAHANWEKEQSSQIRKSNVLPYRGLGVSRIASEKPLDHGRFDSADDFYAEVNDNIRDMIRESNSDRKTKISRKGVDPKERRDLWENKEAISARTMSSLQNSSFLADFAEKFSEDTLLNG